MTKAVPTVAESSTRTKTTRKKAIPKFKRKEKLVSDNESSITTTPPRGGFKRNSKRPQRQRKISVSRSSQVILERKRRKSLRIKTADKVKKEKTNVAEGNKKVEVKTAKASDKVENKRELGRKCKRTYDEEELRNPKRKKTVDNAKNVSKRKYKIVKKTSKALERNRKTSKTDGKTTHEASVTLASSKLGQMQGTSSKASANQATSAKPSSTLATSCKTSSNPITNSKPTSSKSSLTQATPSKPSTSKSSIAQATPSKPNLPSTSKSSPAQATTKSSTSKPIPALATSSKSSPNHAENSKPSPNQSGSSKPSPTHGETLLDKEFSEDSSDDEYTPNEEELNALDDTLGEKSVNEEVLGEELGKETVAEEAPQAPPDGAHYMTRSKVSYTDKALEDIEQAFIPPDIDLDMYDCVIDDQDWKEFLTEFTKPIDKINTNEDDDTEFIPNLQEEEQIDSEEFRRDPGVKVSKKELNELMGELFELDEIYDCDGNAEGNIDENINDYVNLKFNETIHDVSVSTTQKTKETPKKVSFQDTNTGETSKHPVRKQSVENKENSGKGRRKITPDKGKTKNTALSEEINKRIMDEINQELNKYLQMNETYLYKDGPTQKDVTENYNNYEDYIVIIGNQEPSVEEVNKIAQAKLAAKEEAAKTSEGQTGGAKESVASADEAACNLENSEQNTTNTSKEPSQEELSVKLVQKKRIPTKPKKEKKVVTKKPLKPVKEKAEPENEIHYFKYGKFPQKQYKEFYEAYVRAIEMYKANYGVTQVEEMSYHSNIVKYAIPLYREDCKRAGLLPTNSLESENSVIITNNDRMDTTQKNKHETTKHSNVTSKQLPHAEITGDKSNENSGEEIRPIEAADQPVESNMCIETENVHEDVSSLDKNIPEPSKLHLFEEEDLSLLRQQINQHIQYCLQHYLQTYNHPRLSPSSSQAKDMIQTFHTISRTKTSNSFYNSLNIAAAASLVHTWESLHQNEAFKKHIDTEWSHSVCQWRHYSNTLALPSPVVNTILDSTAFIYPVLLPSKSFDPKPRKLVNPLEVNCELNLAVLGFINYAHLLSQDTKFKRHLLMHDVIEAIQKHYLPAHTAKHLAKKLFELIQSPNTNLIQDFFRRGVMEEYRHFIIDYTVDNVVTPRRQHWELLPAAWQR